MARNRAILRSSPYRNYSCVRFVGRLQMELECARRSSMTDHWRWWHVLRSRIMARMAARMAMAFGSLRYLTSALLYPMCHQRRGTGAFG